MKKIILSVFAVAAFTVSQAQDLTSKKGEPYLPETGDWSVGVSANPFLQYAGNLFNGNVFNNAPDFSFQNGQNMLVGKYFISPTTAYRGLLRIGINSRTFTNPVVDNTSTATPPAFTEDKLVRSSTFIGIGAGIEKRRGKTRLQGYYGAQAMLMFGTGKSSYTYGNAYTAANPAPTSTDFVTGVSGPAPARIAETTNGTTFGLGVRGFGGVEYFFLPKMSIGGEFGWGINFMSNGSGENSIESWNGTEAATTTNETGSNNQFSIDTDNNTFGAGFGGQILLNFYF